MSSVHLAFTSDSLRRVASLPEGASGTVVEVRGTDTRRSDRLIGLGVMPGARVTVLQTFPGFVLLCDQTEFAVERTVAAAIVVRVGREAL
jgi:DtxR family Mn-dependent transcriptional regulator